MKGLIFAHHRSADRAHQGDFRTQEPDARDLTDEARPLEVCVKESLVKRSDLLAPFEVASHQTR